MYQPRAKRRKGWFWTGVGLLIGSAFPWFQFTLSIARGDVYGALAFGLSLAATLTGLGIFCLWRSRWKPGRKLFLVAELSLMAFTIVFWNLFAIDMEYEREAGIPIGYLIAAAICTAMYILCYRRRVRIVRE